MRPWPMNTFNALILTAAGFEESPISSSQRTLNLFGALGHQSFILLASLSTFRSRSRTGDLCIFIYVSEESEPLESPPISPASSNVELGGEITLKRDG